jgi:hypothetical protein
MKSYRSYLLVVVLALAATVTFAAECDPAYNRPPRGTNAQCPNPARPYCVDGPTPYCGQCNPAALDWICDCPAGQFCDSNYGGPTYGNCTTNYPKSGQVCTSPSDCLTQFTIGTTVWGQLQLTCWSTGRCYQCNPILNSTVFTCQSGTQTGQTRYCTSDGRWATQGSGSQTVGAGPLSVSAATVLLLLYLLFLEMM